MKGDEIRYIEGNRDHPVNQGVLCAKGSAGIMQHLSPARLQSPLKRVGKRGKESLSLFHGMKPSQWQHPG